MVQEQQLSAVLSEFARNLSTDFPIQGILDHLVQRIVDMLPITGAGVTLIEPGRKPRYVAASDGAALSYERLQTELGEGPCVAAYKTGESVAVPDLRNDDRFSTFTDRAVAVGLGAVFTFPMRHGDGRLGALDLYRHSPGGLDAADMEAAQTLADVAAAYLLNAWARERDVERTEHFRQSALRDPLTDLPNRVLLEQRLERAAIHAEQSHLTAAVLYADLDQFKRINDTYGHQIGDELLIAVARRLAALIRPSDTLARMSGDEFVILCEDLRHPSDAESLARRITEALGTPFLLTDLEITVTASVGVSFAGPGQEVARRLLHNADSAMYHAKRGGGARHHLFDDHQATVAADRLKLERDIRAALARDSLEVVYQPIVRSVDGLVTGVEALLRWNHIQRGVVPPQAVVAAAERNGLIAQLGAWVLERACRESQKWSPYASMHLAVNVSTLQLMSPGFCETVAAVLDRTGTDPATIILEMTEDVFIEDADRAMTVLGDLKAVGTQLALDDFGTGYSSLNYLRQFPVDIVKIDRVFVTDLGRDAADTAIVKAVTSLAHVLDLHVVAEGVETAEQREQVNVIGCESSQGFYYSRPMTADALTRRLAITGPELYLPTDALTEQAALVG